jgi:hypothetical protein
LREGGGRHAEEQPECYEGERDFSEHS